MVGCIPSNRQPAEKDSKASLEIPVLKYHVRILSLLLSPPLSALGLLSFWLLVWFNSNVLAFYHIVSYLLLYLLYYSPSETQLFSTERQKWVDLQGRGGSEELGVEAGETLIRIYHGRKKEYVFNKRKKINSSQKCNCRQIWQQFSVYFNWVYIHCSFPIPANYHYNIRGKLIDLYLIVFFILPGNLYVVILECVF